VASLGGTYLTAPDMNTSESDMDRIGRRCPYVFCRSVAHGGSGSSAPATALGVLHGIRASVGHALDMSDLAGVTVLVQGLGGVGGHLVQLLAEAGAKLLVADIDAARVNRAVRDLGATMVEPDAVIDADCDVFAPCAVGGVLDLPAAEALKSRVVAGAANNQLTDPQVARRLRDRRVLYAPDFVINAGGVLHGVGLERLGWSAEDLQHHLAGIGERLLAIYREADAAGVSTHDAAERAAVRRLDAGPGVRRYADLHTGSRGVGMGSGDAGR
jgi:leucine dehydrogenase